MPISAATASAVNAGVGTTGGLLGSIISGNQAKKNRALQYKMFQEANQFNADQATIAYERTMNEWDRQFNAQNAYNDPSAQFQRNLNAGLNPYASFGSFGNSSPVSANSSPSASSVTPPYGNLYPNNPVNDFLSGINQSMQSSLAVLDATKGMQTQQSAIDALNSSNQRDTLYNGLDIDMIGLKREEMENLMKSQAAKAAYETSYYTFKLGNVRDEVAEQFAQLQATTTTLKNRAVETAANAKQAKLMCQFYDDSYALRFDKLKADLHVTEEEAKTLEKNRELAQIASDNQTRKVDQDIAESNNRMKYVVLNFNLSRWIAREQAKLWRTQGNLNRANEYQTDLISSFGLPKTWRGLDLDNKHKELLNDYQQMFNGRYPILSAPTPEQWFNYMATDGGSVPAAFLYGLGGAAAGVGNIIKPFTGFGFPKLKGKK